MADSNSYRRRAERYKRALLDYEARVDLDFRLVLGQVGREIDRENRTWWRDKAQDIHDCMLKIMRELRGF